MGRKRVVYQDWIVELGHDPDLVVPPEEFTADPDTVVSLDDLIDWACSSAGATIINSESESSGRIREAVTEALSQLDVEERELIERLHFMGQTYHEISEKSGRAVNILEKFHKRTLSRLRKELAPFVRRQYGIDPKIARTCPICRSPCRKEIDELIRNRDRTRPWRQVINILKQEYQIILSTPQVLIGHEKYH
jgi:hypothetical protein